MLVLYGIPSMIEMPIIGGTQSPAKIGDFRFQCVAAKAHPSVAVSCTAPNGILKRIVVNGSKPKLSTIRGPNVEIPPDGIETAVNIENQNQVFTSRNTSLT